MSSRRDQLNHPEIPLFIQSLIDSVNRHSDVLKPTTGDENVTHYVDSAGVLSLEGDHVTQWMTSNYTADDLLDGDGR